VCNMSIDTLRIFFLNACTREQTFACLFDGTYTLLHLINFDNNRARATEESEERLPVRIGSARRALIEIHNSD